MSRRQRSAPKISVSASVRSGLASLVDGNQSSIRSMLDASLSDDLVEKLIDCMGVSNLNAEMLLANYFQASVLGPYARRLGKSDKGGTATLAERIAREWAKPSFAPPPPLPGSGQKHDAEDSPEDAASKKATALEEIKAKRAKYAAAQAAKQAAASTCTASAAMPPPVEADPEASDSEDDKPLSKRLKADAQQAAMPPP